MSRDGRERRKSKPERHDRNTTTKERRINRQEWKTKTTERNKG